MRDIACNMNFIRYICVFGLIAYCNFNLQIIKMNLFLNIIWIVFGGFVIAIEYIVSSVAMMLTIIGIPFGLQTLKLALVALTPFGSQCHIRKQIGKIIHPVFSVRCRKFSVCA